MIGKQIFLGFLLVIVLKKTESATTWMCRGWPHTIKCKDSSRLEFVSTEFVPLGSQCETREGLTPSALLGRNPHLENNCSAETAFQAANTMCKDRTNCMLSSSSLFSEPCDWPDNTMLQINFRCQKTFTCPREVLAISTQRYSRNLHRRPAAWCRDPVHETGAVFLMPWARHGETRSVYEFSTLTSFVLGRPSSVYRLPAAAAGTSLVAYDGCLYYVKDRTRNLTKYNLQSRRKVAERAVDDALYNHEVEHTGLIGSSDIDLAIDENGLWAIYTTAKSSGNIVIAHMNMDDLSIQASWETDIKKEDVLSTFMICGVLYAINKETRRVCRKYDTASSLSSELPPHVNITMPKQETTSVNYNPRDNTLYVWSTSQAIMFTLDVKKPNPPSEIWSDPNDEMDEDEGDYFYVTETLDNNSTSNVPSDDVIHTDQFNLTTSSGKAKEFTEAVKTICPSEEAHGVAWPLTDAGIEAVLPCPDGARGFLTRKCIKDSFNEAAWDIDGQFLNECSSWTVSIDKQLQQENSSADIQKIAQELNNVVVTLKTSEAGVQGHDLRYATAIMNEISSLAKVSSFAEDPTKISAEATVEEKRERLLELNEALLDSGSELVSQDMSDTWKMLNMNEKCEVGNTIMDTVEESAFLVAKQEEALLDDLDEKNVAKVTIERENILVGIQVQKVGDGHINSSTDNNVTFPDPSVLKENGGWVNITDSIQISSEDIDHNQKDGKTKIVFALYDRLAELVDDDAAPESPDSENFAKVNSRIVSATLQSTSLKVQLKNPAIITLEHVKASNDSHTCVYWNTMANSSSKKWLEDGCAVVSTNWTHTVCACNHLTSFAVLVNHQGFLMDEHVLILDLLTWIGLSASLGCLALCIATFTYFKSLHCTRTTIHTNLCICLFMSQLIFLAGIDLYEFGILCSIVAGLLHYCFLATFMWMALEGFQLYVMLIEVFERNTNIALYYLAGYGVPAIFVALSAGLNPMGYGTESACWLKTELHGETGTIGGFTPFIWAFIGPASLVALGNIVFLALTAFTMYRHGRKYIYYSKLRAIRSALRGTCALLCLLGTTWALGILWWWDGMIILQYLFCIFNAFQGLYIFVFHCLMHNKVRYEYRKLLSQCMGDNYTDIFNSSSLTMKYSGMRRRSTQTSYIQKRKNSAAYKTSVRSIHHDDKHGAGKGCHGVKPNSFNDASKFFTREDRASMQILLTRRDSLQHATIFHPPFPRPGTLAERHSFSTRTCPNRYLPANSKNQAKKKHWSHVEEAAPLKRSQSEKRHYRGKYSAPVSEGVSRLLLSANTSENIPVPCRYTPPNEVPVARNAKCEEIVIADECTKPKTIILTDKPAKEFKLINKRIAKFKKNQSAQLLGRSCSLNGAEKKRRDLRKQELLQPSSSVPDLMLQLSAKIESRDISNVLLMYLDKDGTLNRSKIMKAQTEAGNDTT